MPDLEGLERAGVGFGDVAVVEAGVVVADDGGVVGGVVDGRPGARPGVRHFVGVGGGGWKMKWFLFTLCRDWYSYERKDGEPKDVGDDHPGVVDDSASQNLKVRFGTEAM